MREYVSRRGFLATATGVAAAGVAGCSGESSEETATEAETETATEAATATATEADTAEPTETAAAYMNGVGSDASVSLSVPSDGVELTSPSVQWAAAAEGVTIEESGEVNEGAGHYHVLVNEDPVTPGETIPSDDTHVHYGTGQSDGVLELEPGEHTLVLQVADGAHTAMGLTDTVEVTVSDEAALELETSVEGSVVEWDVTAQNYTIEPSSEGINSNAGHLHALIDVDHVAVGETIPSDANHVHFGDGSTSGELDLAQQLGEDYEPGEYTIHFQVGSGSHRATTVHAHTTVTTEAATETATASPTETETPTPTPTPTPTDDSMY